jgi:hypothetical protein
MVRRVGLKGIADKYIASRLLAIPQPSEHWSTLSG